ARFLRETLEVATVKLVCEMFGEEAIFQLESNLAFQELAHKNHQYKKLFELDQDFHRIIFYSCDKRRIWNVIQKMNANFHRVRILRLLTNENWHNLISQHQIIFSLIKANKPKEAAEAMQQHLELVNIEKEQLIDQYSDY